MIPKIIRNILSISLMICALAAKAQYLDTLTSFESLSAVSGISPSCQLIQGPDGKIYGTTSEGGIGSVAGAVFRINPDGSGFTNLMLFTEDTTVGQNPEGGLVLSGNTLYGTTANGGPDGSGTIFAINTDGTGFTNLYSFGNNDAQYPVGSLTLSGNQLYGVSEYGGDNSRGAIFAINTNGSNEAVIYSFNGNDEVNGGLVVSGNKIYGTTSSGGNNGYGSIFVVSTNGTGYTNIFSFSGTADGSYPGGTLLLNSNTLYGTTSGGGPNNNGTVFAININGTGYTNLYAFAYLTNGVSPDTGLALAKNVLFGATTSGGTNTNGGGTIFSINTNGTNFKALYSFPEAKVNPSAALLVSTNLLYGATASGGTKDFGMLFSIKTNGTSFTDLKNFDTSTAPQNPYSGLVTSGSTLYGTTYSGGDNGSGTIFSMNTNGTGLTVLYNFTGGNDGSGPYANLTLSGNVLYGTTVNGGTNGAGTIFAINTDGSGFTNLYSFSGGSDGAYPYASLILSGGELYGTTLGGGNSGEGTIFAISINGTGFTDLYSFGGGSDASGEYNGLTLSGNTLYGNTEYGGSYNNGAIFSINTDGSNYKLLYSFGNSPDGQNPYLGQLVLSGSKLFGTTANGGANNQGTIFSINTDGTGESILYNFAGGLDGNAPNGQLNLVGNRLYGTTTSGGADGNGAIFAINTDGTDFTIYYSFSGNGEGANSYAAPILSGSALYGTTYAGGEFNIGSIYTISATPPITVNTPVYTRNALTNWRIKVASFVTNATDILSNTVFLANIGVSTNGVTLTDNQTYLQYANSHHVNDEFTYTVTNSAGAQRTGYAILDYGVSAAGKAGGITASSNSISMTFTGLPGYPYQIQVSTNLTTWNTIWTTNAPGDGLFQFTDGQPPKPDAFYRSLWNDN